MKNTFYLFIASFFILFSCNSNGQKKETAKAPTFEIEKTDQEWREILSDEAYFVLRQAGTEKPFSSDLNNIKKPGTFVCAACGNLLYKTKNKFESGTGWPSFDQPIEDAIYLSTDNKLGYSRNEVLCGKCGGHLGHVFDDGPKETTGKRYCMNGDAMNFIKD